MVFPHSFVACDLETSGLDVSVDEIIEVGLARVEDGRITETLQTLVAPTRPLTLRIKRLTGLDDSDFEAQLAWESVRRSVLQFIGDSPLIGHNIGFDTKFLEIHGGYRGGVSYDTCDFARVLLPDVSNYRLETVCRALDVAYPLQHRALEDALAAAGAYLALYERACEMDPSLLANLATLLNQHSTLWFPVFNGALKESAGVFGRSRIGTERTGDDWSAGSTEEGRVQDLENLSVDDILGRSGALAKSLTAYEFRPQQVKMAHSVRKAFDEQGILLAEAGTGTGKSFAYLVPGLLWALEQEQRVVVSTHTVNLQEQLIAKDIPLLRSVLPPFRAGLLKGRGNYLCLRRWHAAVSEGAFEGSEVLFLARVMVWLNSTRSGDRSELGLKPDEWRIWDTISAVSDGCAGNGCRHAGNCFVNRSRRAAEQSDVVITNHSLLLSDLKTDNRLLPSYGALVIDEAHHLENVATEQLGRSVSGYDFARWTEMIRKLASRIDRLAPELRQPLLDVEKQVSNGVSALFSALAETGRVLNQCGDELHVRLEPGSANLALEADISGLSQRLHETGSEACARLDRAGMLLSDRIMPGTDAELLLTFEFLGKNGRKLFNDLRFILAADHANYVCWLEPKPRDLNDCLLRAAPIEVGELLYNGLFEGIRPAVLTSATLAVDRSFAYFGQRTGITRVHPDVVRTVQVGSPFVYREQARLFVVNDLPSPAGGPEEAYLSGVCRGIEELVAAAGGRTLVLFTAHRVLKLVYHRLKPIFEEMGIDLLGHGIDGGRARLQDTFRISEKAVLFGASSFWEGVDIPGEALSCLIIVKLPFQPPNQPVTVARRKLLKEQGLSDFNLLSLPQAVLRFKQGFGRLIRTASDFGVAVVLDDRVTTKRYGSQFLRSLPVSWEAASLSAVAVRLSKFLRENGEKGTSPDQDQ